MRHCLVARTAGDIIAEIKMSRTAFKGSFLLLEGDEDIKFWRSRDIDAKTCQFVLAGGKSTVLKAIEEIDRNNLKGVLAIVDDDCDSVRGIALASVNLIRTETRDLETLMLSSRALERLLDQLGDAEKIAILEQQEARRIRDVFISRALIFGQIRYLSLARAWGIRFESLQPGHFGDEASWTFDRRALLTEICRQMPSMKLEDLEQQLCSVPSVNPWLILHGKDSLKVLAVGFRKCLGHACVSTEMLRIMLLFAFDRSMFSNTRLYADIRQWESNNSPYQILPN